MKSAVSNPIKIGESVMDAIKAHSVEVDVMFAQSSGISPTPVNMGKVYRGRPYRQCDIVTISVLYHLSRGSKKK